MLSWNNSMLNHLCSIGTTQIGTDCSHVDLLRVPTQLGHDRACHELWYTSLKRARLVCAGDVAQSSKDDPLLWCKVCDVAVHVHDRLADDDGCHRPCSPEYKLGAEGLQHRPSINSGHDEAEVQRLSVSSITPCEDVTDLVRDIARFRRASHGDVKLGWLNTLVRWGCARAAK